jgi:HlyD family secretion protein
MCCRTEYKMSSHGVKAGWLALGITAAFAALAGCARHQAAGFQGYLEGEFVYVSSPIGGRLEKLAVQKGMRVEVGAPLFTLDRVAELAAQREAADRLRSAQARLEDLKKGSRPTELASQEAKLEQARAAADLSRRELVRQEELFKTGAISANDLDRARITDERNRSAVTELGAQLATARLGARSDAISAAEAEVAAATASRERADWNVDQKAQAAPRASFIYDTLFREGEFVPAATPVVALLPPENLKVRFFVSEADFASFKAGDRIRVTITGKPALEAKVSYLSPQPEFTPPILYNRDNRAKLVFMVEALFDAAVARELHPGQPVEVDRMSQ